MGVLKKMAENIKQGIRTWLNIDPAYPQQIMIRETLDFEGNAIRNRIWYRGDSNELEQLYMNNNAEFADRYKFWASKCSEGMEMRKIHTGLPGLMVRILSMIALRDLNDFEFASGEQQKAFWDELMKENDFDKLLEQAVKETLFIGDGAFKATIDTSVSDYPILEWYSGERIEIVKHRGRVREVVFKTPYKAHNTLYMLHERYGYGYIKNELYRGDSQVDLWVLKETCLLTDYTFDKEVMLAVPFQIYQSSKYEGRGGSIFDGKIDSFDAFDEAWSQWMDALRAGRARTYIPESYIPRDPYTGVLLKPSAFDNRFIAGADNMAEGGKNVIATEQPNIPHESYLASYVTALDLCLQGILSPSTLGIDMKKLDNAEAQREKEKTTLYSRNAIIEALQKMLPKLIAVCIHADDILHGKTIQKVDVNIHFGEYANPSFESCVETVGKARTQGIMSIEQCVEELYGDSMDDKCKAEEIARLKAEQGIQTLEEPSVKLDAGKFSVDLEDEDEGSDRQKDVSDGKAAVSGASENRK